MKNTKPSRVQLSRARGWRMPPNTSKIDRSTKWGNPFKVGRSVTHPITGKRVRVNTRERSIELYAAYLKSSKGAVIASEARRDLRGKNLACWCKHGHACHGDFLLKIANSGRHRQCAA